LCKLLFKLNLVCKAKDNNSTSSLVKQLVAILTPGFQVPSSHIQIANAKGVNKSAIFLGTTLTLLFV
jgi:hypothetical protein